MALKFPSCVEKRLKLKVTSVERNWWGTFLPYSPLPILNRVESELKDSSPVKTIKKEKFRFHCFIACSVEVTCFSTAILLENTFGNIKPVIFIYGEIEEGELCCGARMFSNAQYQPP